MLLPGRADSANGGGTCFTGRLKVTFVLTEALQVSGFLAWDPVSEAGRASGSPGSDSSFWAQPHGTAHLHNSNEARRKGSIQTAPCRRLPHGITAHTRASLLGKLSAGIGNPRLVASCRLGHPGRTTITVVIKNPKPDPKSKDSDRSRSHGAATPPKRRLPSTAGKPAVQCRKRGARCPAMEAGQGAR